jgi:hypothetical protein
LTPILFAALVALVPLQIAPTQPAEPTAPLAQTLGQQGVEDACLDTTFRFAAEFNTRSADRRRGSRIVGVAESFIRVIAPQIYPMHGPVVAERARDHLRTRLQAFLEGYVNMLIDQGVRDIELRKSESIDQYLNTGGTARCNQIPCRQPPCCKDCSAPAGSPPKCSP